MQNAQANFVPPDLDLEKAPKDASNAVEDSMLRGGVQKHLETSPKSHARRWLKSAHFGPKVKEPI